MLMNEKRLMTYEFRESGLLFSLQMFLT